MASESIVKRPASESNAKRSASKLDVEETLAEYYISKCVLRGSPILHALYGHFRSSSSKDVVFGKETSIELLVIDDFGYLQSVCEQPVFGIIKDLALLPCNRKFRPDDPEMDGKDLLIALSDSKKMSLLSFCNERNRFFPIKHVELIDEIDFQKLAVDSSGCFIAASAHEDHLALFSLSMTASGIIDKRIMHHIGGTVKSMCFISRGSQQPLKECSPILAVVLDSKIAPSSSKKRKRELSNELRLLEWSLEAEKITLCSTYVGKGPLAHAIVEIPNSKGFSFLFRDGDFLLMDLKDPFHPSCLNKTELKLFKKQGNHGSVCICCWSWESDNNRMICCVDTGELCTIEVSFVSDNPEVYLSESLYKCLPCKQLLWANDGYIAAIVEKGDGKVLKLKDGKLDISSHILNIAPILDVAQDVEHEQMFACCGVESEGSLRTIQRGIGVEKILDVKCDLVNDTWAVRMKENDLYHSFIVVSCDEETTVFSAVDSNFPNVTKSVGFQSNVRTVACGLVSDGLLVQICPLIICLCLPVGHTHPSPSPICTFWCPPAEPITKGAVGNNFLVVSTCNPLFMFILGVRHVSNHKYEMYGMQSLEMQDQISCISIPSKKKRKKQPIPPISERIRFVIGTWAPSVEIWSVAPDGEFRKDAACTTISATSGVEISEKGLYTPHNVCFVYAGKYYVLAGLRNGMLLRFEWLPELPHSSPDSASSSINSSSINSSPKLSHSSPDSASSSIISLLELSHLSPDSASSSISSSPDSASSSINSSSINSSPDSASSSINSSPELSHSSPDSASSSINLPTSTLQLIASRCIGNAHVFLVPLEDTLDADIIALSDRPWLLHTAGRGISCTSLSFQSPNNVTPVCTMDYPKGILFYADNRLHLVEMVHNKRLTTKSYLDGTPRKVLYHYISRTLLVMMESSICCVNPQSGKKLQSFELDGYGRSMEFFKFRDKQLLAVGISSSSDPGVKPNGETKSGGGSHIVYQLLVDEVQNSDSGSATSSIKAALMTCFGGNKTDKNETWQLENVYEHKWRRKGVPLAICPYLDHYFLASAGKKFYVYGIEETTGNKGLLKVELYAKGQTRFIIRSLTTHGSRIAVGDGCDGVIFFSYDEDEKKLAPLYADPSFRLLADCILMDDNTAVVSDRKGSIAVLCSEVNVSPERNLRLSSAYFMGDVVISIQKCLYSFPADRLLGDIKPNGDVIKNKTIRNAIIAPSLKGNVMIFFPLLRKEYMLLKDLQEKLVVNHLTEPILGNFHAEFRSRENSVELEVPKILDGDMLTQFLELTCMDKDAFLQSQMEHDLLERIHYALN